MVMTFPMIFWLHFGQLSFVRYRFVTHPANMTSHVSLHDHLHMTHHLRWTLYQLLPFAYLMDR